MLLVNLLFAILHFLKTKIEIYYMEIVNIQDLPDKFTVRYSKMNQ